MWPLVLPTPVLAIQYLLPYSRYLSSPGFWYTHLPLIIPMALYTPRLALKSTFKSECVSWPILGPRSDFIHVFVLGALERVLNCTLAFKLFQESFKRSSRELQESSRDKGHSKSIYFEEEKKPCPVGVCFQIYSSAYLALF